MTDGARVAAPHERGWGLLILALGAFLLVPHLPGLPAMLPLVDTAPLLIACVAACSIAGWWMGGSVFVAFVWTALAAAAVFVPASAGTGQAFAIVARGFELVLAGAFGVMLLVGNGRSFTRTALGALGVATLLALLVMVLSRVDPTRAVDIVRDQLGRHNAAAVAEMRRDAALLARSAPSLADLARQVTDQREQVQAVLTQEAAPLFPALLGLEALAAYALAWALYHRLSRARVGPPLAPLATFTFSHELVWALVAGIAMLLVPTLHGLAAVGRNLVLFFGALYALRGYGIYASFVSRRAATTGAVLGVALFPLSLVTAPAALGLGLSDTWIDWRQRAAKRGAAPFGGSGA